MNIKRLKKIISKFKKAKILVVGDLILDEFIWGNVTRICPEAPVPVVCSGKETRLPGGAANVASNLSSLGAKTYLVGVVGEDNYGSILLKELRRRQINIEGVFLDKRRPTTLKTRIIADHQQVVRLDRERTESINKNLQGKIFSFLEERIPACDVVVIEDYGKGMVRPKLISHLIILAKKYGKIITVDPKEENFSYYRGVNVITPNQQECEYASGVRIKTQRDIDKAGRKILKELDLQAVLITLGDKGMRLFEKKDGRIFIYKILTVAQEVYDVTGAGDTVIAALSLALASGASNLEAAQISNFAAGVVVGKIGVAVTSLEELKGRIG